MTTPAIHHVMVAIPVGGEAAARTFYGDLLGLPEIPKPKNMAARGGLWFIVCGLGLHLGLEADFQPARKAHIAYEVSSLDDLRFRLESLGTPTRDDVPLAGYRRFHTEDPFGNRVELLEAAPHPDLTRPTVLGDVVP